MEIQQIEVNKDFLSNIIKNNKYNHDVILDHYSKFHAENPDLNLGNKLVNIYNCNSWFLLDKYEKSKIKDFKKTNLCKDKFCNNCKKVKQASRMSRFIPQIELMKNEYNLYLLTLTVPNCNGTELSLLIKKMFKCFNYLNRYFNGHKKIKGLDFGSYGYAGALRSLEITFRGDNYHPHIHAVIALDKNFDNFKSIEENNSFHINSYSYNNKFENGCFTKELTRIFSDFEVLIQKIWYLLINGEKVTLNAIEGLSEGYSCTLDSISESSYYEVFKYMTKATDESNNILSYDNFKTLYFALHRVRQIQGYGIFYNFKDDDSDLEELEKKYDDYINGLKLKEDPKEVSETPLDLFNDNEYTLVSRKKIYSVLKDL